MEGPDIALRARSAQTFALLLYELATNAAKHGALAASAEQREIEAAMEKAAVALKELRDVIEKRMFSQVEDLLPVISFGTKKDSDTDNKHAEFVSRMPDAVTPYPSGMAYWLIACDLQDCREECGP